MRGTSLSLREEKVKRGGEEEKVKVDKDQEESEVNLKG